MSGWILYGANGYTGELIAREAKRRHLTPILAGRSAKAIERLAGELDLPFRAFGLDDAAGVIEAISGTALVLNCAGPFSATAAPLIEACLRAGAHYLDITGEIAVLEHARSVDARARDAGVVVCPGVGFDVIPTDCVASALKSALPDATSLALGFDSRSGLSPGTAKTAVEGLADGGRVRRDGKLETVRLAHMTRRIDFGAGEKLAMTIPWGDVATAYHSTGIADIEVYIPASAGTIRALRGADRMRWLLRPGFVQRFLKRRIEKTVTGPDAAARELPTHVWGEVTNDRGERRTARIVTANGYALTVTGSLAVVEYLLGRPRAAGYHTPSTLMGSGFVSTLPGSGPIRISDG